MKLLAGKNTPKNILLPLAGRGFSLCLLPPSDFLDTPVCTHADMLTFQYKDKIIIGKEYYRSNKALLDSCSLPLETVDIDAASPYPHDIPFDCFNLGDTLFCKENSTPDVIKSLFSRVVNVNQGYARCSCVILPDMSVITSDKTIFSAVKKEGYDPLYIECKEITLPGYKYGFIGGASLVYEDTVCFTGDIFLLSAGKMIYEFCIDHGCRVDCLTNNIPFDCGSFTRCLK